MNNKTTMERFSRANQNEDSSLKILNSGIRRDDRILIDTSRSGGSFSAAFREDFELQRRLLTNELQNGKGEKVFDKEDSEAANRDIIEKY